MKKIVIATGNEHKLLEFQKLLEPFGYKVCSLNELHITLDIEENGKSFKDNALIKARYVKRFTDDLVLADDSGLSIEALNGFPGIYSARFMAGYDYKDKCQEIIKRVSNKSKKASFHCALALIDDKEHVFEGIVDGFITEELKGNNGFGYDPIFYCDEAKKNYAEMTSEEKNRYSHRGKAIKMLLDYLNKKF